MSKCFSLRNKRIWVAGHRGMVGSAVIRRLQGEGCDILTNNLDLRVQADVKAWVAAHKPDAVVLAAAKVGGKNGAAATPERGAPLRHHPAVH